MKAFTKKMSACIALFVMLVLFAVPFTAFAAPDADTPEGAAAETTAAAAVDEAVEAAAEKDDSKGAKAIAAAIAIAIAAAAGALSMGIAIAKSAESISRQPEVAGQIRTSLMLGLVFIETAIIYALIVAILIIFVL